MALGLPKEETPTETGPRDGKASRASRTTAAGSDDRNGPVRGTVEARAPTSVPPLAMLRYEQSPVDAKGTVSESNTLVLCTLNTWFAIYNLSQRCTYEVRSCELRAMTDCEIDTDTLAPLRS